MVNIVFPGHMSSIPVEWFNLIHVASFNRQFLLLQASQVLYWSSNLEGWLRKHAALDHWGLGILNQCQFWCLIIKFGHFWVQFHPPHGQFISMGGSINGGTPKWLLYSGKSHLENGWFGGTSTPFMEPPQIATCWWSSPHHHTASSQGWGRQRSLWVPLSAPSQEPGPPESPWPPGGHNIWPPGSWGINSKSIDCWRHLASPVPNFHQLDVPTLELDIYIYISLSLYLSIYLSIYIYIYVYLCVCAHLPIPVLNLCLQDLQIDVLIILVLPATTDVSTL